MWCDTVVNAAVLINNGCRFECTVAGFKLKQCRYQDGARYVYLLGRVSNGTVLFGPSQ